jgi:hypothetical protein
MSRHVALVVLAALLASCGSSHDDPESRPSPTDGATGDATATPSPTGPLSYDASGCPVDDEAFCATAVDAIDALQAADADELYELSREDRLVCAKVNREYFPGCETDNVLVGHGSSGANFVVEVLDEGAYRGQLEAIVTNVDPAFSDELGDGSVRVVGVGTCGPDVPGRRTYHLAWTAAVSEGDAPAERLLGSFEFLSKGGDWRIVLWYLSPLVEWEAEQPDPLEVAFCEAGRTPWPPATA